MTASRSVPGRLRAWLGGFAEGVRAPCGKRRPMRWSTVWRMVRPGHPPFIQSQSQSQPWSTAASAFASETVATSASATAIAATAEARTAQGHTRQYGW